MKLHLCVIAAFSGRSSRAVAGFEERRLERTDTERKDGNTETFYYRKLHHRQRDQSNVSINYLCAQVSNKSSKRLWMFLQQKTQNMKRI